MPTFLSKGVPCWDNRFNLQESSTNNWNSHCKFWMLHPLFCEHLKSKCLDVDAIGGNELGNSLGVLEACNIHATILVLWFGAHGAHWKMGCANGGKIYCVGWCLTTPTCDLFDIFSHLRNWNSFENVWNICEKHVYRYLCFFPVSQLPLADPTQVAEWLQWLRTPLTMWLAEHLGIGRWVRIGHQWHTAHGP